MVLWTKGPMLFGVLGHFCEGLISTKLLVMKMYKDRHFFRTALLAAVLAVFQSFNSSAFDAGKVFDGDSAPVVELEMSSDALTPPPVPSRPVKWTTDKPEERKPAEAGTSSSAEEITFWEKLTDETINGVCKGVSASYGDGIDHAGLIGVNGKVSRSMKQYPDGNIALVDEARLKFNTGKSARLFPIPNTTGLNIGVSA